jgi:hypothetical protein
MKKNGVALSSAALRRRKKKGPHRWSSVFLFDVRQWRLCLPSFAFPYPRNSAERPAGIAAVLLGRPTSHVFPSGKHCNLQIL